MNKIFQVVIVFVIILIFEAVPFLYNDTYTVKEMKWGWIVGFPLVMVIYHIVNRSPKS